MHDGMSILKTFTNETEAQMALNHITALGVSALLQMDNCGGMRPHFDISRGVDLLVADDDLEKAKAALEAPVTDLSAEPWTCPSCGENIEAGFDVCWKCGKEK